VQSKAIVGLVCVLLVGCSVNQSTGYNSAIPLAPITAERALGSSSASTDPTALQSRTDYEITLANGNRAKLNAVSLSRLHDSTGDWISVRGKGFDWQYRARIISSIALATPRGTGTRIDLAAVPLRAATASAGARRPSVCPPASYGYLTGNEPDAEPCDGSCGADPYCSGGSAWGECNFNRTCGYSSNSTGTGYGDNNPTGDTDCQYSFVDQSVTCVGAGTNDLNAPADLFLSFRLTVTDAILTCANPVNIGYATATYSDPNQRGGRTKHFIPTGPGQHTWDFPADYVGLNIGPIYPPVQPIRFAAAYYKYGITTIWDHEAQGYCKYPYP
jgi:hypothetical protein